MNSFLKTKIENFLREQLLFFCENNEISYEKNLIKVLIKGKTYHILSKSMIKLELLQLFNIEFSEVEWTLESLNICKEDKYKIEAELTGKIK